MLQAAERSRLLTSSAAIIEIEIVFPWGAESSRDPVIKRVFEVTSLLDDNSRDQCSTRVNQPLLYINHGETSVR